ncbi:hypothetical protein D9M68_558250 [compost metagenome]
MAGRGRRLPHYLAGVRQRVRLQHLRRSPAARLLRHARRGIAGVLAGRVSLLRFRRGQRTLGGPLRVPPAGVDGDAAADVRPGAGERSAEHDADLSGVRPGCGAGHRMLLCAGGRRGAALVRPPARNGFRAGGQRHRGGHAARASAGVRAHRRLGMARRLSDPGRRRGRHRQRGGAVGRKRAPGSRPASRWRARGSARLGRVPPPTGGPACVRGDPQQGFCAAVPGLPGQRIRRLRALRAPGPLCPGPWHQARTGRAAPWRDRRRQHGGPLSGRRAGRPPGPARIPGRHVRWHGGGAGAVGRLRPVLDACVIRPRVWRLLRRLGRAAARRRHGPLRRPPYQQHHRRALHQRGVRHPDRPGRGRLRL